MRKVIIILLLSLSSTSFGAKIDSVHIEKLFDLKNLQEPNFRINNVEIQSYSKQLKNKFLEGYFYYNWSLFMYYQSNLDSAFNVSKRGIEICGNRVDQKSNKLKLLNLLASYYTVKQDFSKALDIYQTALKIATELNENLMLAKINCNVANLYFGLLDYDKSYDHSAEAYKFILAYPKDQYYASIISVLAVCESKLGKNELGLKHANEALRFAEKTKNPTAIVVSNHALGEIYFSQNKLDIAIDYFQKSLILSKEMGNVNFVILNDIGLLHSNIKKKNFAEAILFGEEAKDLLKSDSDKTRVYAIKKQLAEAYNGVGKYDLAYQLLAEAHENYLQKSGLDVQESIKELEVKYNTAKKEKELVKSELNLLTKESDLQNAILLGFLLMLIVALLSAALFFIRYRNRKKLEIINKQKEHQVIEAVLIGEEAERERLAIELHDGLASVLTAARYKLQTISTTDKKEIDQLTELLQSAHEDTRRMSHKLAPLRLEQLGLISALNTFVSENSSSKCEIHFTDLSKNLKVTIEKAIILYRVGQELIQNALKHSEADQINIQISNENGWFSMMVEDNGKGFDSLLIGQTNGLGSIHKRVKQLDGEFYFDSKVDKGTVSIFKIPLN